MEASHQPLMPAIDPLPSHTHIWSIMCYYPGFDNPRSIILRGSLRELLDIFTISQEYKGEFVRWRPSSTVVFTIIYQINMIFSARSCCHPQFSHFVLSPPHRLHCPGSNLFLVNYQGRSRFRIVIALTISLLEVVLSVKNAVENDSWKLTNREDFVFSASSLMEAVGLVCGVASFFLEKDNNRLFSKLGLPLVVLPNGVLEDVREIRASGMGGIFIQATFILILMVWSVLVIQLVYRVLLSFGFLISIPYYYYNRTCGNSEVLQALVTFSLCFLPLEIEIMESIFLIRDFSLNVLALIIVDVMTILPGVLWLLVQVRRRYIELYVPRVRPSY